MTDHFLEKIFEHNNWANLQIIQACSVLTDEQLDAEPHSVTKGSIRQTLLHLVASQRGYLALLTEPVKGRPRTPLAFTDLQEVATASREGLLALAREAANKSQPAQLETTDGYIIEPWVVVLQAINHATEHREQINSMLTALGVTPLNQDGWAFGEATSALIPKPR